MPHYEVYNDEKPPVAVVVNCPSAEDAKKVYQRFYPDEKDIVAKEVPGKFPKMFQNCVISPEDFYE